MKNSRIIHCQLGRWRENLLRMKLIFILLLGGFLTVHASSYSQITKLNLELEDVMVKSALKEIEKQSDFYFFFNEKEFNAEKKVTLDLKNATIDKVLDKLLEDSGMQYEIIDRYVVIKNANDNDSATQDQKIVSGNITDKNGLPLPGVSVVVKGTTTGVITDIDGNYSVKIPTNANVLQFSFIGMKQQEITVDNQAVINVILEEETLGLNEVVVVGYGVQRKIDVTGAVGAVSSEDLLETPAFNALQGIKGKVSGVNIFSNSGSPTGTPRVMIRGIGTINSSSDPLYVVDGVVMEDFHLLNPNDIERIEVLKDASSAAIYGARGANGVILVTTKRGAKEEGVVVSYDGYISIGHLRKKMDLLNANEWLEVIEKGYENAPKYKDYAPGNLPVLTRTDPRLFDSNGNPLYDTDWQEEATRTAISHNHQISVQQKSEKSSMGAFLNYSDNEGIMHNSWMRRVNTKLVYDANPKKWLSLGVNLLVNSTWGNYVEEGGGHQMPRRSMIEMPPIFPVKFPDGTWSNSFAIDDEFSLEGMANPVHVLKTQELKRTRNQIFGNAYFTFHILDGLDLKTQIGIDKHFRKEEDYKPKDLVNISAPNGWASINNNETLYWQEETYLTYNKDFGNHRINSVLGLSWQERTYKRNWMGASGFADDFFKYNYIRAANDPSDPYSSYSKWSMNSYFLRFGYTYNDKYLATVTARADGSSRFGDDKKYGYFPSVGLGWVISNEDFMSKATKIDHLKLRASYGITGNTEIGTYSSLATVGSGTVLINGVRETSSQVNSLANPNLEWEKTSQFDIGFNLSMFKQRINMELDYYYKETTDLLLGRPVPHSTGFNSVTDNIGSVSNKGIDFLLTSLIIDKPDFRWESTFNLNYNKNEIEELGENDEDIFLGPWWVSGSQTILRVGESLSSFWGYRRLGTWGTDEAEAAAAVGAVPGVAKRSAEKEIIGKGIPDITGSFINRFSYKNWDLTVDIQFVTGVDILQQYFHSTEDRTGYSNGLSTILYDGWTEQNQNTMVQQIRNAPLSGQNSEIDDHWVCNGAYIRGNLISLGYTFNKGFLDQYGFKHLRVYGSVSNAFVIHSDDFKGYDPEATSWDGNQWGQNMFFFQYPKPTTFTFGVNVKF